MVYKGFSSFRRWPLLAIAVGLTSLMLYLSTIAPDITWANYGADGGDLIAAAMTSGVPHPTGYPTYVLLGRAWAKLPFGNVAFRFNLLSAAAAAGVAALTCGLVERLLGGSHSPPKRVIAACTGLSVAAGRTLWSQAVITEVYSCAALVVAGCLYLALRQDLWARRVYWLAIGALFGLGLGVHLTVALLVPALLVLLWPGLTTARLGATAGGVLLGLVPFAYLPLAARGNPPVNWGNPQTWPAFWWVVSGQLYHGYAFNVPLEALPARLSAWASLLASQWGWHGLLLGLLGWQDLWRRQRRAASALGTIFLFFTVYALGYNTPDSFVYLIPAFLSLGWAMASGALFVWAIIPRGRAWRVMAVALLLSVPVGAIVTNHDAVDASHSAEAREWLEMIAGEVPPNAILVTGEDGHTFAAAYLQWVEGRRQDILVVDGELWRYGWYSAQVRSRWPALQMLPPDASLGELINFSRGKRPVLLTTFREGVPSRRAGMLWIVP